MISLVTESIFNLFVISYYGVLYFSYTLSLLQVVGACWYILSVERQDTCWRQGNVGNSAFNKRFLDCASLSNPALSASRATWFTPPNSSSPTDCSNSGGNFNYGIYKNAIAMNITTKDIPFPEKYLYCLWTGLLSLRLDIQRNC